MKSRVITLLLRLIGWLPLGVARRCGWLLGELSWHFNSREAKVTRTNIALCYPALSPEEQQRLARASLREWGCTVFEIPVVLQRSSQWLQQRIKCVHNEELLDRAVADPRGLICLSPHLGNWEVTGLEVARRAPMTTMYEPPKDPKLDQWIRQSRAQTGAQLVPTNARGVLALIKALKAGGSAGVLPDQQPDLNSGRFVPFFGVDTLTMTLVHSLVSRTDAQVLFCFSLRVPGGFEMFVLEPEAALASDDVDESVAALSRGVERCVAEGPTQYQWEYKRFKKRPEGQERLY